MAIRLNKIIELKRLKNSFSDDWIKLFIMFRFGRGELTHEETQAAINLLELKNA